MRCKLIKRIYSTLWKESPIRIKGYICVYHAHFNCTILQFQFQHIHWIYSSKHYLNQFIYFFASKKYWRNWWRKKWEEIKNKMIRLRNMSVFVDLSYLQYYYFYWQFTVYITSVMAYLSLWIYSKLTQTSIIVCSMLKMSVHTPQSTDHLSLMVFAKKKILLSKHDLKGDACDWTKRNVMWSRSGSPFFMWRVQMKWEVSDFHVINISHHHLQFTINFGVIILFVRLLERHRCPHSDFDELSTSSNVIWCRNFIANENVAATHRDSWVCNRF